MFAAIDDFAPNANISADQPPVHAGIVFIEKLKCEAPATAITLSKESGRVETTMNAAKKSQIKLDISHIKGGWEVVIFIGDQTEHRSFRTEAEARAYGKARIEQLRLGKPKSQMNGATTSSSC